MHYLNGISTTNQLYHVWHEVGALTDHSILHQSDPLIACEYSGKRFCLYRNPDFLEEHLISLAPEDTSAIRTLIKDIKKINPFPSPFYDVPGLRIEGPKASFIKFGFKMLRILPKFASLASISIEDYMARFKNRGIREMFRCIADKDFSVGAVMYLLSSHCQGDLAYIEGGSQGIAFRMADRFKKFGGELILNQTVSGLDVVNGRVKGVVVGSEYYPADVVISSVDALEVANSKLWGESIQEPWMKALAKEIRPMMGDMLSLGVKCELTNYPFQTVFPLSEPLPPPYKPATAIKVLNYSRILQAPPGCCSLILLPHGNVELFEYWKKARNDGTYSEKKRQWTEFFQKKIEEAIPQTRGKVEFAELSTAATFQRYLGSYKGSYMSYHAPSSQVGGGIYPQRSSVVKGLYWTGMRMFKPGGLPPAVMTGRKAVQYICKDLGTTFR
jgi:phytoene dehydrogenase-like protein